jgi:hypothetical protein
VTRNRRVFFTGIVLVLIAAVSAGTWFAGDRSPIGPEAQILSSRVGAVPGAFVASCVETYDLVRLKNREFAFDGTVTQTEVMKSPADGAPALDGYLTVTFHVNEWFRGGAQDTVTVDMIGPSLSPDQELSYGVGSRLLVTGEPRLSGSPLMAAVAWGCGFTHYYDQATAAAWRQAFAAK